MLVDTHAHLNFPDYQKDLDQVIDRSLKAGVKKIICVSSNLTDSQKAIEIAQKYPGIVYAAVGIHPHATDSINYHESIHRNRAIKQLEKLASQSEVVAIGECGLDYSPAPPGEKDRPKKEQLLLFKEQIKLAQKLNLPILIHSRQAFPDVIQIIKSLSANSPRGSHGLHFISACHPRGVLWGVFHCYSAGKKGVQPVLDLGFYFGFDGNLTYDEGLQNVAKEIPLEKILLETDAPFLAPEPFRGQRSEPAQVKIIAECLAKIKGISFEKVSQTTSQNAQKLFKIQS